MTAKMNTIKLPIQFLPKTTETIPLKVTASPNRDCDHQLVSLAVLFKFKSPFWVRRASLIGRQRLTCSCAIEKRSKIRPL